MMNPTLRFVLERLGEFSTWRGVAALAATAGVIVAPETLDAIYKAFIAILGVAAVLAPNRKAG